MVLQKTSNQEKSTKNEKAFILSSQRRIKKTRLIYLGVLISLVVIFVAIVGFLPNKETTSTFSPLSNVDRVEVPAFDASPQPFADLTIPYIREREFKSSLGEMQQVSQNQNYTSYLTNYDSDGFKVNGLLTKPSGSMPEGGWPAIVFVHGYIPPESYRTTQNYASYVDYLARNGFVVYKIDLRGHADSEGEASGGYYSGDYVIDTLNARAALESSDFVNDAHIGFWGHSMAGNIIFRSFVASQNIPAIVIWAGAVYTYEDFETFAIDDESYRPPAPESNQSRKRKQLFDLYGQFAPDHPFWKQVAPTNYLKGVTGSVQIHHAVDDSVVPIGYSRNLKQILASTGIELELHEYETGGHNLTGSSFTQAMQRTVDFFQKHLQ